MIDLGARNGFLANEIGRGEPLMHIAELVMNLPFEVAGLVVVQQRRARSTRLRGCVIGRKLVHLELNQLERTLGGVRINCSDRRDRLAAVAHPLARQRIFVHGNGQYAVGIWAVVSRDHADDTFEGPRLGNIEPDYFAVTYRAAENPTDQSVDMFQIRGIARAAGHLLDAVDQWNALPRDLPVTRRSGGRDLHCGFDRFDDFHVSGAPTEIAGERRANILVARIWTSPQQCLSGHDHAGSAEAALGAKLLVKGALQPAG